MQISWHCSLLLAFLGRNAFLFAHPLNSNTIDRRGDEADAITPSIQAVTEDDDLPQDPDVKDAYQDYDFDYSYDDLKELPDFDPDPPADVPKRRDNSEALTKRGTRSMVTAVLRNIRINRELPFASIIGKLPHRSRAKL